MRRGGGKKGRGRFRGKSCCNFWQAGGRRAVRRWGDFWRGMCRAMNMNDETTASGSNKTTRDGSRKDSNSQLDGNIITSISFLWVWEGAFLPLMGGITFANEQTAVLTHPQSPHLKLRYCTPSGRPWRQASRSVQDDAKCLGRLALVGIDGIVCLIISAD